MQALRPGEKLVYKKKEEQPEIACQQTTAVITENGEREQRQNEKAKFANERNNQRGAYKGRGGRKTNE